jgi:hypothetical protein
MKNDASAIIEYVLAQLKSLEFSLTHRTKPEYFSRNPKMLTFENTVKIILNLLRRAIAVETMSYFNRFEELSKLPSRQAFSEARDKISYLAFKDFFEKSCEVAINSEGARLYKGYRLYAIDGTSFFVGDLKDKGLHEYFGESTTVKGRAMCRISAMVDVINNCIVDASVSGYDIGERALAIGQVNSLEAAKNALLLFDRGYWSPELLLSILANKQSFLMRIQSNHVQSIAGDQRIRGLGLRFVSFPLPSGETENLLSNLPVDEVSDDELFELYAMRWGIESKYLELKDRLEIDNLSEKSLNSVLQDIYATLYMSNLTAFLCSEADDIIQDKTAHKDNKYQQKANRSNCISLLRDRFIAICLLPSPSRREAELKRLVRDVSQNVTYVDKSKPRQRDKRKLKNSRLAKPSKSVL